MTTASTTVDDMDEVEKRFCSASTGVWGTAGWASAGQPIDLAKFSIDDVFGLFLLASTLHATDGDTGGDAVTI